MINFMNSLGDHAETFNDAVQAQLAPNSKAHKKIVDLVVARMDASRKTMSTKHSVWSKIERNYWCIVDEAGVKKLRGENKPVFEKSIVMPVTNFMINSRVTNIMQILYERAPLFPMAPRGDSSLELGVKKLETQIELQVQMGQYTEFGHNLSLHGDLYGIGFRKTFQDFERGITDNVASDVFSTFPDCRQRISDPKSWEYIGFQYLRSYNQLKMQPQYFNLKEVAKTAAGFVNAWNIYGDRMYGMKAGPRSAGRETLMNSRVVSAKLDERDKGVFIVWEFWTRIIPEDYFEIDELMMIVEAARADNPDANINFDPSMPMKWVFGLGNGNTVIRAEPDPHMFKEFPVGVISPLDDGVSILCPGIGEMMGPIQEICSWLPSSRMHNVYQSINETRYIDPSAFEIKDITGGLPVIRLRRELQGTGVDIRKFIYVHQPANVTESHWKDFQVFLEILQRMTAATDVIQGQSENIEQTLGQFEGLLGQALGRIADVAKRYYTQDWYTWGEQIISNTIQWMPESVKVKLSPDSLRQMELLPEQADQVLTRTELLDPDTGNPLVTIKPFDPRNIQDKRSSVQALKDMLVMFLQDQVLRQEYPKAVPTIMIEIGERSNTPNLDRIFAKAVPQAGNPLDALRADLLTAGSASPPEVNGGGPAIPGWIPAIPSADQLHELATTGTVTQ